VLPFVLIAVWQGAAMVLRPREWLLPSPAAIAGALWDDRGRLWFHAQATIATTLAGLAIAVGAGVLLALLIAWSRSAERAVYPWVVASQTVPVLAVAPLLVVWLDPEPAMLALVALVAFFPVVVAGVDGLRAADPLLARTVRTMGARPGWVWRHVLVPGALPGLFTGLRMAAVFAVTGAVVGEYVGAERGLGAFSKLTTGQFQTALTFAAVAWLALIGVALFAAVSALERLALPHRHRAVRRRTVRERMRRT
jgi:ABC-type nitrate/sulfonate/bicarbonate transport system permease component